MEKASKIDTSSKLNMIDTAPNSASLKLTVKVAGEETNNKEFVTEETKVEEEEIEDQ